MRKLFVAVLLAVVLLLAACEAGGDFVYVCDEDGRCEGSAHWWVEGGE